VSGCDSRTSVKDALLRSTLRLQSDTRLVELLRGGFGPAFDVVVERYRVPLTRYCSRMVGPDHADDVVQETFTAGFTALGNDDRPIQLKPWLYRVAHNTAISVLRKKGRQDHEELDENYDGVRQPQEHFEQRQRLHELVARMRALPERQRTALVLQELEGRTPEEIAVELGGTVPMVRQLVHRGRERLRNGVGALVPLPLLLKLFGADTAVAATTKAAAATAKPAGAASAGVGATGSGAKLAVVLSAGLLAGGAGVAVQKAVTSPERGTWQQAAANSQAGSARTLGAKKAPAVRRTGRATHNSTQEGSGKALQVAAAPSRAGDRSTDGSGQSPDGPRGGDGSAGTTTPGGTEATPPAVEEPGSAPAQAPPAVQTPVSGGGGTNPGGGGGQPAGGSPPGGGTPTEPSPPKGCDQLLPVPLPVCVPKPLG
jgi:RNA polymerase sigma factor (sigma-70 family)